MRVAILFADRDVAGRGGVIKPSIDYMPFKAVILGRIKLPRHTDHVECERLQQGKLHFTQSKIKILRIFCIEAPKKSFDTHEPRETKRSDGRNR